MQIPSKSENLNQIYLCIHVFIYLFNEPTSQFPAQASMERFVQGKRVIDQKSTLYSIRISEEKV